MTIVYIDEKKASTCPWHRGLPFKNLSQAYLQHGPENDYQVKKKDEEEYKPAAESTLRKAGILMKPYDALTLTRETSMDIVGELWEIPAPCYGLCGQKFLAWLIKL